MPSNEPRVAKVKTPKPYWAGQETWETGPDDDYSWADEPEDETSGN